MLVLVCLEIVLILTQDMCTFGPNIPQARKSFFVEPIEHLGDVGRVESYFGPFGDIVSIGARCKVCAKRNISSKIVLDTPDGTPR
jgi:hypothetical protein